MRRIINWLMLPALLTMLWLLLNQTLAWSQVVLGALLSLLLAWAAMALRPLRSQPKKPLVMISLFLKVLVDITKSNSKTRMAWRRSPAS